jgi:hypothetical protein
VAVSLAAASNSGGDATAARYALAQLQALIESSVPVARRFSEVGGMFIIFPHGCYFLSSHWTLPSPLSYFTSHPLLSLPALHVCARLC